MPADRAEIGPAQLGWRWALRGSQQDATRPFWALFGPPCWRHGRMPRARTLALTRRDAELQAAVSSSQLDRLRCGLRVAIPPPTPELNPHGLTFHLFSRYVKAWGFESFLGQNRHLTSASGAL